MTDKEISALENYAASIGVTRAAACALIVQRELNVRQLKRSSGKPNPVTRDGNHRRVTIHVRNEAVKSAFTAHVKSLGLGSDEAAGELFRRELEERWLFTAFALPGNHS